MGNLNSKQPASKMGITAIALTTPNMEKAEVELLMNDMKELAKTNKSDFIPKSDFEGFLAKIEKFDDADKDICMKLFVLFDVNGDKTVNWKDYTVALHCCVTTDKLQAKMKFVLGVYDKESTGYIMRKDLKSMMHSINNVASYFGDPVLSVDEVNTVETELYKSLEKPSGKGTPIETAMEYLLEDETIKKFLNGEGKVRFGDPELKPP